MKALTRTIVTLAALSLFAATATYAQDRAEPMPKELEGVGITEKLGAQAPKDLAFTDSEGNAVRFGDYFKSGKPVIVTLNYSDCPMLCSLQLNQFVTMLRDMRWTVGNQFEIVTVSLDPNEKPERAAATKARYVKDYARMGAAAKDARTLPGDHVDENTIDREREAAATAGWHFVVGSDANVHALADAIGFGYSYNEARKEYLHVAALMLMTPEATVSRYMYGLMHSPETVRLSLVEASEGKSGSTLDKVVLYCFHYDATAGKYAPVARNVMRAGGGITVVVLSVFLGTLWLRDKRKKSKRGAAVAAKAPAMNEVGR